jgi:uncharacterized coiled-coil DUF342 family protein
MQEENPELTTQMGHLQEEISNLRRRLSEINNEKEALFTQRQDIGRQISNLIKDVKGVRSERDTLTGVVRLSKDEREKLNEQIRVKIEEVKKLKDAEGTPRAQEDPRRIKREIERLEFKIETDVMSFEKEKQLMKVIKEMKKTLAEADKAFTGVRKIRELSHEIDDLKAIANSAHAKVQEGAKESQAKHEALVQTSKQIDELKAKEEEFNKQITEKKALMTPIAAELDAKNAALQDLRAKMGFAREEDKKVTAEKRKKKLSELQAEVTDKMKRGDKLTTEDLLIMQGQE